MTKPSVTTAISVATTATLALFLIHKRNAISSYYSSHRGVRGLLRYIWVGDYLPQNIRDAMDELDTVEERMAMAEVQLETIEILIERTLLESVDGPDLKNVVSEYENQHSQNNNNNNKNNHEDKDDLQKQLFQQHPKLKKDIALFSSLLDRLAASIDAINSHSDEEVKKRKKSLSNKIVTLMNELDRMLALLNLIMR